MTELQAPGGLVHALLLDGSGGASEMDWHQVDSWTAEQGCLWLHFNFTAAGAAEWLRGDSKLNALAAEALLSDETRPRARL